MAGCTWYVIFPPLSRPGYLDVYTAVDFFNHLNMLYGTVTEFCTPQEVRVQHPYSCDWLNEVPTSVQLCLQVLGRSLGCTMYRPYN